MEGNKSERAQALAAYLKALAMLEQTGNTYVTQEIRQAIEAIQRELGLKK